MTADQSPDHEHHGQRHDSEHNGHDRDHEHDHEHTLIVDRLPEGAWHVDPHGSELLFKAKAFGVLPVTGVFEDFRGDLNIGPAGNASGQLVIQMASINTGWRKRDATLRGTEYFRIDDYPEMIFTLEKIEPSGSEHMNLSGALQIQQKTAPLNFPVYAIAHGDHLHLEGQVMVDHDVAGLGWGRPFYVGDRLRLEAALTLIRA